jgi:hypothetical protein
MLVFFLRVSRLNESKAKLNYLLRSAEILDEQKARDFQGKWDVKIIFSGYLPPRREILETGVKIFRKDRALSEYSEWI